MAARKWNDLSQRNRRLIVAAAVAEASLKTAALIDIKRQARPDPGLQVGLGHGGSNHQLLRGRTPRILRLRAAKVTTVIPQCGHRSS